MSPLPEGIVREVSTLLRAGREQEARALVAAWPGMTPEQVDRFMHGLADADQTRAEATLRGRAMLGASGMAVAAGVIAFVVGGFARSSTGIHGVGAASIVVVIFFAVVIAAFAAGWRLFSR